MGRNTLIHTWSLLPCAHTLTQGCSMRQQPRVQPKGLTLLLCSFWAHFTCGNGMQNPTVVLTHQWGWAVPEQSLASVLQVLQVCALSSGPPACCIICRDKSIHSLQAAFSILEISVHDGLSAFLEMSFIDIKTQGKLHPRCLCYDLVVFSGNTWHL